MDHLTFNGFYFVVIDREPIVLFLQPIGTRFTLDLEVTDQDNNLPVTYNVDATQGQHEYFR